MEFKRRMFQGMVIALLFTGSLVPIFTFGMDNKELSGEFEYHVGPGYPISSIQMAIDMAESGDKVIVHEGVYRERIRISKCISLEAAPGETYTVMIDDTTRGPPGTRGYAVLIDADEGDGAKINGGTFSYIGTDPWNDTAIKVQYGKRHVISNVEVYGSHQGIWIHGGDVSGFNLQVNEIWIHNNTVHDIAGHGIYLQKTWAKVEYNTIRDCGDGIMVAHEWTASRGFGWISNNQLENCSTGVNFVASNVYDYKLNEFRNCSIGEEFNASDPQPSYRQTSIRNDFHNCDIGTKTYNMATPYIEGNTYDTCNVSIRSIRSNPRISDVDSSNTSIAAALITRGTLRVDRMTSSGIGSGIELSEVNNALIRESFLSGEGDFGLFLNRSKGLRIYESDLSGYKEGIVPKWDTIDQLNHQIPVNNTMDSKPIYYSFGDKGVSKNLDTHGQVIICNASVSNYKITSGTSSFSRIIRSSDIDMSGSIMTKGMSVTDSERVIGDDVEIKNSILMGTGLSMLGSNCSFYNSRIEGRTTSENAVKLDGWSELYLYGSTLKGEEHLEDWFSSLHNLNRVGIELLHEGGEDPVENAEYEIWVDGNIVNSTEGYGGNDDKTGSDGRAGPFWILNRTNRNSGVIEHMMKVNINVTADGNWEGTFPVDSSYEHFEQLTIGDVRRPSIPQNPVGNAVPERDVVNIRWDQNTDDAVSYKVYMDVDMQWEFLSQVEETTYDHKGIPHDTQGTFRITAVDEVGLESLPSSEVTVTSKDGLAPEAPKTLKIEALTVEKVVLSWSRSPSSDVIEYELHEIEGSGGGSLSSVELVVTTKEMTAEVFEDFTITEKRYAVRAKDEAGLLSPFSNPVSLSADDLTWPEIVDLGWMVGSRRATISFKTTEETTSTLWFGTSKEELSPYGWDELGMEHIFEFDDLALDTTYHFYVFVIEPSGNNATDDNDGELYTFTTISVECYLHVYVKDLEGNPLSGVKVVSEGEFLHINVVEKEPGHYLSFLIPGFWTVNINSSRHRETRPVDIFIKVNETKNVTFFLQSLRWNKVNLKVKVLDPEGKAVFPADVEIDGNTYSTAYDGSIIVEDLDPGRSYTVRVGALNFSEKLQEIILYDTEKDQELIITLELQKEGDDDDDEVSDDGSFAEYLILILPILLLILIVLVLLLIGRKRAKGKQGEVMESWGSDEVEEEPFDTSMDEGKRVRTGALEDVQENGDARGKDSKVEIEDIGIED
ncbi:MAG: right-handed parallel beta-helix repeat-containing protein [Thermoplasmatota archaeon]